ncbi:MAG: hypothetical protein P1V97_19810 [Planctomycetota bacterium]|nr:hypothetical protein [Planctomycetota bacterium]
MTKQDSAKDSDDDYYDDRQAAPRKSGMSTMLIVGLVFGGMCVLGVPIVAVVAAIAIPNLLEARKHGNEASAIGSLRTISVSQAIYFEREGNGRYGSLNELSQAKYVDGRLGTGKKQGYRFEVETFTDATGASSYWAKAYPGAPGDTGDRYFFLDSDGLQYYSNQDFTVNRRTGKPNRKLSRIGQ